MAGLETFLHRLVALPRMTDSKQLCEFLNVEPSAFNWEQLVMIGAMTGNVKALKAGLSDEELTINQIITAFGVRASDGKYSLAYGRALEVAFPADYGFPGDTALHIAVRKGHVDAVKTLLEHKPDLSIINVNGKTAEGLIGSNAEMKDVLEAYKI